jgi:hypothetical protein
VAVLDGVNVAVGVRDGVNVTVGVLVGALVGVNVTTAHKGTESPVRFGFIVLPYSS